ncbi:MAG: hypothetical protein WC381_03390 [Kiritimatiellia bacterium]|jgi:hypothetical protein
MKTDNNSGVILVAVVCFTAITAILALGILSESGSQLKMADRQVRQEQAFYVAEGGAERAVSCIRNSAGAPPGVITGAIGNGTYGVTINSVAGAGLTSYTIVSTGEVNGVKKSVMMSGVRQQTWARFALWYNDGPGAIWIRSGEVFNGPVHANTFIYLRDDPIFNALISTTQNGWGPTSVTNAVAFNQGFQWNAPVQDLTTSVNFTNLLSNASLVITGSSQIALSGTNVLITNARRGWTAYTYPVPSNGLIYVRSTGAGTGTNAGTVQVGGTLDGRLSIAADYDIGITNHIRYANTNIPYGTNTYGTNTSDDALGLIANHDVVVRTSAPNNLNIFAHIIAVGSATASQTDGSFYVQNHDSRAVSGFLNLWGGVVQFYRGAVGTFSGTTPVSGFSKRYTFDTRFLTDPPPRYPTVNDIYLWSGWRDKLP